MYSRASESRTAVVATRASRPSTLVEAPTSSSSLLGALTTGGKGRPTLAARVGGRSGGADEGLGGEVSRDCLCACTLNAFSFCVYYKASKIQGNTTPQTNTYLSVAGAVRFALSAVASTTTHHSFQRTHTLITTARPNFFAYKKGCS